MIFIEKRECYSYPGSFDAFSPSEEYPEYLWKEMSVKKNTVYDMVRSALWGLELDKENYGTGYWNPFKHIIKAGDTVLVKPNMVMHVNGANGDMDCLITHPSVVRAVLDYVCIALKGSGKIILGDAPMQLCDYDNLIEEQGYREIINFYKSHNVSIDLCDFREITAQFEKGNLRVKTRLQEDRVFSVDLKNRSFHAEKDHLFSLRRITNYDCKDLIKYHCENSHIYKIIDHALQADVIINMPKPKTHRKAGMTGALKNMVGVIGNKNCLPHHMKGAVEERGDEYYSKNIWKRLMTNTQEKLDSKSKSSIKSFYLRLLRKMLSEIVKRNDRDLFSEGSWYGNDTIWRTILDINRILIYSDKKGQLQDTPQRKMFVLGDMINCGEGEGPLLPENKWVGIIVAGNNFWEVDNTIAEIMKFSQDQIPYIVNAPLAKEFPLTGKIDDRNKICVRSNIKGINGIVDIEKLGVPSFKPTHGWAGHIERVEKITK